MSALCRSRRELSNAYLLAKFGFDTAENEPSKVCRPEASSRPSSAACADSPARYSAPGAEVPDVRHSGAPVLDRANLTGFVLGCIEAKFCKKICVWKLSPRSTQCTPLNRSQSSICCLKISEFFAKILLIPKFVKISLDFGQVLPEFCWNFPNLAI